MESISSLQITFFSRQHERQKHQQLQQLLQQQLLQQKTTITDTTTTTTTTTRVVMNFAKCYSDFCRKISAQKLNLHLPEDLHCLQT